MSAHTPGPAAHGAGAPGQQVRLRWWAVAPPLLAFGVLLACLVASADAEAASGSQPLGQLLEHVLAWLP